MLPVLYAFTLRLYAFFTPSVFLGGEWVAFHCLPFIAFFSGCEVVGTHFRKPIEHARLKYQQLDEQESKPLIDWVRNWYDDLPAWNEGADLTSDGIWHPKSNQKVKF